MTDLGAIARAGLCASCTHHQIVTSSKGSTFVLCGLSETDPRFAKYPRLPVVTCFGYLEVESQKSKVESH